MQGGRPCEGGGRARGEVEPPQQLAQPSRRTACGRATLTPAGGGAQCGEVRDAGLPGLLAPESEGTDIHSPTQAE